MIGVIDSGLGGLSVLRELVRVFPGEKMTYVGDSAHCPYGTKSPEEIQERCFLLCDYLIAQGADLIVIACNSATIAAVGLLRAEFPIPIVGMEPAIKPAAKLSKTGVIGVFATEASLRGEKFHRLVSRHATGLRVIKTPCPEFVRLVEQGQLTGPEVDTAFRLYADPMLEKGADVLILGCTHYPFLYPRMRELLPPEVHLLETGRAVAKRAFDLRENSQPGSLSFLTSGDPAKIRGLLPKLIPGLTVDIERFTG